MRHVGAALTGWCVATSITLKFGGSMVCFTATMVIGSKAEMHGGVLHPDLVSAAQAALKVPREQARERALSFG